MNRCLLQAKTRLKEFALYNLCLLIAHSIKTAYQQKMSRFMYFCGSIRGGRQDAELYYKIIEHMKTFGTVLTEHVGSADLTDKGEKGKGVMTSAEIYDRDMEWLKQCDVVIAEVTTPSLGVGYEIGRALDMDKKILCLFRESSERNLSAMIEGADKGEKSFLRVKRYNELDEAKQFITQFLT